MPSPNPYQNGPPSALWQHATSRNTGLLFGVALSLVPRLQEIDLPVVSEYLAENGLPRWLGPTVLSLVFGYVSAKTLNWVRWKTVKSLLTYQGWMTSPKSKTSKLWAMLVRCLSGPCPYSTYQFQNCLPHLPVPALDASLDRWLEVSKPLLTPGEYEATKTYVEEFRKNEGPKLQQYLIKKADSGSWINDYWLNGVYLATRAPLAANSNISGQLVIPGSQTTDPLARAAVLTSLMAKFHNMLEKEEIPPVMLQQTIPLCMHGYRYLFNTARVPGEYMDDVATHPGKSHIIVIRKGHYFKVDLHGNDGTVLTAEEIKLLLQEICSLAEGLPEQKPISALTGQRRDIWAKHRQQLLESNKDTIKDIESAIFMVCISDVIPKDFEESSSLNMTSHRHHTWFDKSFSFTVYGNGTVAGANVDHTSYDAVVPSTMVDYVLLYEEYVNGDVKKGKSAPRPLKAPQQLLWDVSGMKEEISAATKQLSDLTEDIDLKLYNAKYGKGFMKKCRLSPDGYIQMILQLAYYKLHKEIVRTYEPATLRFFYLGRTETINPVSESSVDWVKSMCDERSSKETRKDLLVKAVQYQTTYRLAATIGNGCDRHLFALMCASRELGMDMPKLFMDKSWQMPYKLSTSQTPTQMFEFGSSCDYRYTCWGFGPTSYDSYAISYAILGDDILNFHIVSYKGCETTSTDKFVHSLEEAMEEMKELFIVS